jgi:hypothetical protein
MRHADAANIDREFNPLNLHKLYWNRFLVYACLAGLGGIMLLDAAPQYTLLHSNLKRMIDPVLDKTGLWQGSWELFAPIPDHVNVRVGANLKWADGRQTTWLQPNWHEMSAWEKMRNFRRMSYFDELWQSANSPAWDPFCQYLANEQSAGKSVELTSMVLFQDRDVIALPSDQWRPAYSAPQYGIHSKLITWFADDE